MKKTGERIESSLEGGWRVIISGVTFPRIRVPTAVSGPPVRPADPPSQKEFSRKFLEAEAACRLAQNTSPQEADGKFEKVSLLAIQASETFLALSEASSSPALRAGESDRVWMVLLAIDNLAIVQKGLGLFYMSNDRLPESRKLFLEVGASHEKANRPSVRPAWVQWSPKGQELQESIDAHAAAGFALAGHADLQLEYPDEASQVFTQSAELLRGLLRKNSENQSARFYLIDSLFGQAWATQKEKDFLAADQEVIVWAKTELKTLPPDRFLQNAESVHRLENMRRLLQAQNPLEKMISALTLRPVPRDEATGSFYLLAVLMAGSWTPLRDEVPEEAQYRNLSEIVMAVFFKWMKEAPQKMEAVLSKLPAPFAEELREKNRKFESENR